MAKKKCCAECGSDDVIKVSQLYIKSISVSEATTEGYVLGVDSRLEPSVGYGSATTRGVSQTLEGRKFEPPQMPSNTKLGCILTFIYFGLIAFLSNKVFAEENDFTDGVVAIGTIVGILFIIFKVRAKTKREMVAYHEQLDAWNVQWTCNRCGYVFV